MALVALLLPTQSIAAPLGIKRQQQADATWLIPTNVKNHFIAYYAAAWLDELGEGEFSWDIASIGKGRCVRKVAKRFTSMTCTFTGWASGKASETFTMDPAMQQADLTLERKGRTLHVGWTGEEPGFYESAEGCMSSDDDDPREGHGGGLFRSATATGDLFGKHLVSGGPFGAMLMSGAMVTECSAGRALSGLQPGQTMRVSL